MNLAVLLSETTTRLGGNEGPDLTRYLTVCVVLLAGIGVLAWGFRALVARTVRRKAAGRSLQILDVLPLGPKQRLAVVRCYDRTFALGLADHSVTPICELDSVIGDGATATSSNELSNEAEVFETLLQQAPLVPPRRRRAPAAGVPSPAADTTTPTTPVTPVTPGPRDSRGVPSEGLLA